MLLTQNFRVGTWSTWLTQIGWLLGSILLFAIGLQASNRWQRFRLPKTLLLSLSLITPLLWQVMYSRVYHILSRSDSNLPQFWLTFSLSLLLVTATSMLIFKFGYKRNFELPAHLKPDGFTLISILIVFPLAFYIWRFSTLYMILVVLFSLAVNFAFNRQTKSYFNTHSMIWLIVGTLLIGSLLLNALTVANPQPVLIIRNFGHDLLFLGLLLSLVMLSLALVPPRFERILVASLGSFFVLLSVVFNLVFAYNATVGVDINWFWLQFFVNNVQDTLPYILAVSPTVAVSLGLSFPLLTLLLWVKLYRELSTSVVRVVPHHNSRRFVMATVGLMLVFGVGHTIINHYQMPLNHRSIDTSWAENPVFALIYDIYTETTTPVQAAGQDAIHQFNSDNLRFVETPETIRPNIVMIILESTRAQAVTPYNTELSTTPFINSLAQQGMLVEDMNVTVPFSNDSIFTLLTGNYPDRVYDGITEAGLPALLRPLGYETAYFTPYSFEFLNYGQMLQRLGYDTLVGYNQLDQRQYSSFGSSDYLLVEPSLDWVDQQIASNSPFLLTYFTQSCHHPYDTNIPDEYAALDIFKAQAAGNVELNKYYNCVHHLDAVVETIIAEFEARDLTESTIFFIVGDHGEQFGEHGETLHGEAVWQEGLQVPAIIYAPALKLEPATITGPRQQIDWLPTLADLMNLEIEGGELPGKSLLAAVDENRRLFMRTFSGDRLVLREGPLKYIFRVETGTTQVYNVETDPTEQTDLSQQLNPAQLDTQQLDQWLWYQQTTRNGQ